MGLMCCCSLPPSACKTCPNYLNYYGKIEEQTPWRVPYQPYVPPYYPLWDIEELKKKVDELTKKIDELKKDE